LTLIASGSIINLTIFYKANGEREQGNRPKQSTVWTDGFRRDALQKRKSPVVQKEQAKELKKS